ncbi:MAG: hypothetical protein KGI98_10345 [Euryarchaeota archaeon]|nr:hypothetical protein [Euryarchaeota archaeon]MDE1880257.1 hypothetical protein [Euryarchaeota archaeon]MDE2044684.1 hypothetical protein [Thermoplasmata archaeon]
MKRVYKVSIEVTATFERKVRIRTIQKELAARLKLPEPWKLAGVSSRSVAKPERTEKPKPVWEGDVLIEKQLGVLREILADLRRIRPGGRQARLELWPNRWCKPEYGDRAPSGAHSHLDNVWVRLNPGQYPPQRKRVVRKSLICISPKEVLATIDTDESRRLRAERWKYSGYTTDPVWLMAHEWMHKLMPGGGHKRAKFKAAVAELEQKYAAMKTGTWTPPVPRKPGWVKAEGSVENTTMSGQTGGSATLTLADEYDGPEPTAQEEAQRRMREMEESERQR